METPKILISVIKEETGYSGRGNINGRYIFTQGEDYDELRNNIFEAINLAIPDFPVEVEIIESI